MNSDGCVAPAERERDRGGSGGARQRRPEGKRKQEKSGEIGGNDWPGRPGATPPFARSPINIWPAVACSRILQSGVTNRASVFGPPFSLL